MQFDSTINLGDLITFIGGVIVFVKVLVMQRDALRDLARAVGTQHPPTGLYREVHGLKRDVGELKTETYRHREVLISRGLVRPQHDDRLVPPDPVD